MRHKDMDQHMRFPLQCPRCGYGCSVIEGSANRRNDDTKLGVSMVCWKAECRCVWTDVYELAECRVSDDLGNIIEVRKVKEPANG